MSCDHNCSSCNENCQERIIYDKANKYSSIKKIIGIVSGKGGVGKSMVTSLLAKHLTDCGYSVGIMDADITGPSIPKAFNIKEGLRGNRYGTYPNVSKNGVQVVSCNLLLEDETDPVIWRGPVISNLVKQFYTDIIWKDVDYLLIDMPPGTSDVSLTVFQSIPVDGIIIVTSPQDLVSMIVTKAIKMAEKMNVEVLGLVENYSYLECDNCGHRINIFGESKALSVCEEHNLDLLGRLPIDPRLASLVDKGDIESYDKCYLEDAIKKLESLSLNIVNVCIPVNSDESINKHLKHCKKFNLYSTSKQMVLAKYELNIEASSKEEIASKLKENNCHVLLVDHACDDTINVFNEEEILVISGVSGISDEVCLKYLYNELDDSENTGCGCDSNCNGDCENCSSDCGGCGGCH